MLFLLAILVDAVVLGVVLTLVGGVKVSDDFTRPLAVIFFAGVIGAIASWLLGGALWGLPQLAISIAALFFLIRGFFDLPRDKIWTVLGAYFVLRLVISLVLI